MNLKDYEDFVYSAVYADKDDPIAEWKKFHDINFVNINYKPFDASEWPIMDSGLLGPVELKPIMLLRVFD